ncbi:MAG: hypothetical protein H7Z40_06845 [Phycisphaerae bacterium]|nr:hypothetical protein [Gemmatimonadaceae bacterium]
MTDEVRGAVSSLVQIVPTLEAMAQVYALSREGGPKSARFAAYVALAPTQFGFVPYNPMAGDAALTTVQELIAMNAESVALASAASVVGQCEFTAPVTLALAVRSKGMWTDRIATEVEERVTGKARVPHHGVVNIWSRDAFAIEDVMREAVAEAVRVMWHATHGTADTLLRLLTCEGLAYALHPQAGAFHPTEPLLPEEEVAVAEAIEVLGDSRQPADIAGILYGDAISIEMGYTPLGLPAHVGYRWGVHRARQQLAVHASPEVLRMNTF